MKKALTLLILVLIGIPVWYFNFASNVERAVIKSVWAKIINAPPYENSHPANSYSSPHFYAGMPVDVSYPGDLRILKNIGFVVGYDENRKNPAWVCYRVFRDDIEKGPKRPSRFSVDERTASKVSHDDYTNSGFDRGHMAPNWAIALRYGVDAQTETFLMSNVVPQKPNLNQGPWRELEEDVAKIYGNQLEEVWVITGPIYDDAVERLVSGVEIPDSYYKIIVDQLPSGEVRVMAFEMPQEIDRRAKYEDYGVSVNSIEKNTGLDFLSELEDELEVRIEETVELFPH